MIVDTHVHVLSGDRQSYPVVAGAPNWPIVTADALLTKMDALGIGRAVLVQSTSTTATTTAS